MTNETRILVVDDDLQNLALLELLLTDAGHVAFACDNAGDALSRLQDNDIDIVLTDIKMPQVSGLELLRDVHTRYPEIPVILMTAYAELESAVDAVKDGAFDFLIKPHTFEHLFHSVAKAQNHKRLLELEKNYKLVLERTVKKRTQELTEANNRLRQEIIEHKKTEQELQVYQEELLNLSAELSLTEERERRRIANELHDDIGQTLARSRINLESLLQSSLTSELTQSITETRDLIVDSVMKVRSLTSQISPPLLYEVGFVAALKWLGDKCQQDRGIKVEIAGDSIEKELDEEVGVTLFQIVRELLINITKHAKVQTAKIMINAGSDKIEITVVDNGIGFEVSKAGEKEGFGLFNIRQKIKRLGGEITFESRIGNGTRVSLLAPFKMKQYRQMSIN